VEHLGVLTRALRNVSRRKMRVLLVVIALGFSMAIMMSIPSGIVANQATIGRLNENYNNIISGMEGQINQTLTLIECSLTPQVTPGYSGYSPGGPGYFPGGTSGYTPSANVQYLNESLYLANISSIQGVAAVVPILQVSKGTMQNVTTPFGRTFSFLRPEYTIVGVPLNSSLIDNYPILPTNITEGQNLKQGDSGVVLLSLNNTEYFGVGVGGKVNINGTDFTVVGVYGSTSFEQKTMLYMNITDAQRVTNYTGEASVLDVYAENSSVADTVASEISSMYPELSVTSAKDRLTQLQNMEQRYADMLNSAESNLGQTQTIATEEIIIAVVATSLIVLFVMLYTVRERTKEIGTLKAIGFSNWNVMSQFMLEGVFMSLIAGVFGIAIGSVGAPIITSLILPHVSMFGTSGTRFVSGNVGTLGSQVAAAAPTPQLMLLAFGVAVLLGALGSLYPAWRASRTSPMEALRYE
jgi:putative ABC transport system permease protein